MRVVFQAPSAFLDAYDQSEFGARWISEFTTRFDCVDDGLTFYGSDGRDHSYPLPTVGLFHYDAIENITLVRSDEDQLLLCRGFERKETYVRPGQRFVLTNISLPSLRSINEAVTVPCLIDAARRRISSQ